MTQLFAGNACHDPQTTPVPPTGRPYPSLAEVLADPRSAFSHPADVVAHPLLSRDEKRTILISWARDELMLAQLAHGVLPELRPKSRIDAVIAALRQIDPRAAGEYDATTDAICAQRRPVGRWRSDLRSSSA